MKKKKNKVKKNVGKKRKKSLVEIKDIGVCSIGGLFVGEVVCAALKNCRKELVKQGCFWSYRKLYERYKIVVAEELFNMELPENEFLGTNCSKTDLIIKKYLDFEPPTIDSRLQMLNGVISMAKDAYKEDKGFKFYFKRFMSTKVEKRTFGEFLYNAEREITYYWNAVMAYKKAFGGSPVFFIYGCRENLTKTLAIDFNNYRVEGGSKGFHGFLMAEKQSDISE